MKTLFLLLTLTSTIASADTFYVTQSPTVPHGYIVSSNPQPYAISTPKTPELKPICQGYGKDYATMNWLQCAKDGQLGKN